MGEKMRTLEGRIIISRGRIKIREKIFRYCRERYWPGLCLFRLQIFFLALGLMCMPVLPALNEGLALELPSHRRIVVGGDHNYPPFEYLDENGRPAGFVVDLTRAIAREMNLDMEIRLGPWADIVKSLEHGEIDAIQGMFYSPERDLQFDFTQPHAVKHYVGVVRKGEGDPPGSMPELEGKRIVLQRGDIIHDYLVKNELGEQVSLVETQEDVLRELAEGKYDCALAVRISSLYLIEEHGWRNLALGRHPFASMEYCYAVSNDRKALLAQLSEGLKVLDATGEFRRIQKKWLGVYEEKPLSLIRALRYSAMILIPIILMLLAIFLWSWSLRKQVARRTEDLRRSEDFQRAMISSSPVALYCIDLNGNVLAWNVSAERIFGWTAGEVIGKPLPIVHEEKHEEFADLRKRIVEGGSVSGVEIVRRRKDGSLLDASLSAAPIHDARGNITGIMGAVEDITHRKAAEKALWESEKRYRDLFQNSTDFVYTLDLKGTFTDVNRAGEDLTGYTKSELIGMNYREYIPEPDHERIFKAFRMVLQEARPLKDFPFEVIIKDGTRRHFETCVSPLMKGEEIIGFQGSSRDVTERIGVQEERKKLQDQLSNALEMARLGHWEYDVARDLFTFNDHFYKIFRTTAAEVGGYTLSSAEYAGRFVHPEDIPVVAEEIRKAIEATEPNFKRQLEHRIIYGDGSVGYISVQFFIFKDALGKTVKTYGVNQDITERKRLEEEFLKVQKLESLGVLAGGIAHDFNNILTTIMGNIALAKDRAPPGNEVFDLLHEAEMGAIRAQTLTRQLLTFAKGGVPIKETSSIEDVLRESATFVLRGSKSRCEFSIADDLRPAEVDPGQISQVIHNVVINADQAMPEGGLIRIAAENCVVQDGQGLPVRPGRYIRISIADQGMGIAGKHFSRIFDPYFTTKQKGSGLGLATTLSIIKKHDGHVTVESRLEDGATFHIYLPASEKAPPEKRESGVTQGSGRILVMDDEAPLRKMLGQVLSKLGYESEFAGDGAEAVRMVKKARESGKPFDAVILDLTVPGGMGGKEAIRRLLEIDPGVKAIVFSGYSDDPVLANFREYGFKGMIPKPFDLLSLGTVLHEVLLGDR
ncbi:MAG: PAS domain S-box protein [Deltaproteobacteria bacterium]|nr:PAS domain S-box protein [Deltaproteobacteria bacterium]